MLTRREVTKGGTPRVSEVSSISVEQIVDVPVEDRAPSEPTSRAVHDGAHDLEMNLCFVFDESRHFVRGTFL